MFGGLPAMSKGRPPTTMVRVLRTMTVVHANLFTGGPLSAKPGGSFLAEISVKSPLKLFIFIISFIQKRKYFLDQSIQKKNYFVLKNTSVITAQV